MERREGERWVEKEGEPDFCQTANKDGTCTLGVVIIHARHNSVWKWCAVASIRQNVWVSVTGAAFCLRSNVTLIANYHIDKKKKRKEKSRCHQWMYSCGCNGAWNALSLCHSRRWSAIRSFIFPRQGTFMICSGTSWLRYHGWPQL